MGTLANSEDLDEMSHNVRTKSIFREIKTFIFKIMTFKPSIYSLDHLEFILCSFMEISINLKSVIIIMVVSLFIILLISVTFDIPETSNWVKGNSGMFGYYRVNYDPDNWNRLIAQLNKKDHTVST